MDQTRRREKKDFREAATLAALAHSIAGGIESPIQFILQVGIITRKKYLDINSCSIVEGFVKTNHLKFTPLS